MSAYFFQPCSGRPILPANQNQESILGKTIRVSVPNKIHAEVAAYIALKKKQYLDEWIRVNNTSE